MKIRAYLKPRCCWSRGVRAILRKYGLEFEVIDVSDGGTGYDEMVLKSGQSIPPCVEIDGIMLADVSGEEIENYLLANDLIKPNDARMEAPAGARGTEGENVKMTAETVRFF